MCLCNKINKIYSANGLSQGRPIPYAVKQTSSQVMIKKTPYISSRTKNKKKK